MNQFRRRKLLALTRLQRVNRAVARLEEWEAAQLMPAEVRPEVEKPTLGRKALESLRETCEEVLAEMELMWERRN